MTGGTVAEEADADGVFSTAHFFFFFRGFLGFPRLFFRLSGKVFFFFFCGAVYDGKLSSLLLIFCNCAAMLVKAVRVAFSVSLCCFLNSFDALTMRSTSTSRRSSLVSDSCCKVFSFLVTCPLKCAQLVETTFRTSVVMALVRV